MFVGHYGVSFAAKKGDASVPLWVLFVAVQLLDFAWAPLVLLGVEKVRIVPGFTRTNALDLYYMPYTHSLVAAVLWSARRRSEGDSMRVDTVVLAHDMRYFAIAYAIAIGAAFLPLQPVWRPIGWAPAALCQRCSTGVR